MTDQQGGCLCLDAPVRALSRAADSACDLYVRSMSGCASRVPVSAVPGGLGAAFGRSAMTVHMWASSDRREDVVPVAPKQRRIAPPEPVDVGAANKGSLSQASPAPLTARRRSPPAMGTIAEEGPYEFGASALRPPPPLLRRRGAAMDSGWFDALVEGNEFFDRRA